MVEKITINENPIRNKGINNNGKNKIVQGTELKTISWAMSKIMKLIKKLNTAERKMLNGRQPSGKTTFLT